MSNEVYTSSIVPPGQKLVNVRNGHMTIPTFYIEVFEIAFGFLIVAFILGRQYKAIQKKKEIRLAQETPAASLTPAAVSTEG